MKKVTLISTIHSDIGKCNADELCDLIDSIKPEIIFLEAVENTYTQYEKDNFESFGVFHHKLEIKAMQKYTLKNSVKYIPVLDHGLSEAFTDKYNLLCQDLQFKKMIDNFNSRASENGFDFLNSDEGIELQDKMRKRENFILNNNDLNLLVLEDINRYENSMLAKIAQYCNSNDFENAIFMCGVAHRVSLINKIKKQDYIGSTGIHWAFFGRCEA